MLTVLAKQMGVPNPQFDFASIGMSHTHLKITIAKKKNGFSVSTMLSKLSTDIPQEMFSQGTITCP